MHAERRGSGSHGSNDLGEIPGCDLLACHASSYDVCGRICPSYNRFSGLSWLAGFGKTGRIKISRRLAKSDDDAAIYATLSDMYVALLNRALKPAVPQLEFTGLISTIDGCADLAARASVDTTGTSSMPVKAA